MNKIQNHAMQELRSAQEQNNSEKFFQILFDNYFNFTVSIASQYFGNKNSIGGMSEKDIAQETFIKFSKKELDYFDVGNIKGLIRDVSLKIYLNLKRDGKISDNSCSFNEMIGDRPRESKEINDIVLSDALNHALTSLPNDQANIFRMRLNGYKFQEIAKELGLKESNVKYHFSEAKRKLKKAREKYDP